MKCAVLCASPRLDGNSRMMADALAQGVEESGNEVYVAQLGPDVTTTLRDCKQCRLPSGDCAIRDGYEKLLYEVYLPADAVVYAMPLWWYGMPAVMKNFFDRMVCYVSARHPGHEGFADRLAGKRAALLLASEERFPTAGLGIVFQFQEICRYIDHQFVGVVNGIGNTRGEVRYDPARPLGAARELGARMFDLHYSDYNLGAERPNAVWPEARAGALASQVGVYDSDV